MTQNSEYKLSASDVLERVRVEIARPESGGGGSAYSVRVARVRALQREFWREPVGGRLLPLKRFIYWFVASAFDRQAKIVEAVLDLVRDLGEENESLQTEIVELQAALSESRRQTDAGNSRRDSDDST